MVADVFFLLIRYIDKGFRGLSQTLPPALSGLLPLQPALVAWQSLCIQDRLSALVDSFGLCQGYPLPLPLRVLINGTHPNVSDFMAGHDSLAEVNEQKNRTARLSAPLLDR